MAPPSTLILGPAKSGTTALFYAIRAAMTRATGAEIKGLFEPRDMDAFRRYFAGSGDPVFLCKALLGPVMRGMQRAVERFDRRIVLSRDPRDNIVSRLLFMPPRLLSESGAAKADAFQALIARKQAEPASLSIVAILREVEALSGRAGLLQNFRENAILPARILKSHGDRFWMFGYDDLVEGRFDRLSTYLGFEVTPDYEVGGQHGYVSRSKGSGEWRSWFLPEDVEYFAGEVAEDYVLMGFDPAEAPDPTPRISPETSSGYVQKQVDRQHEKRSSGQERKRRELEEVAVQAKASAKTKSERAERRAKARALREAIASAEATTEADVPRQRRKRRKAAAAPEE